MKISEIKLTANIPDLEDFEKKYPPYKGIAKGEGKVFFEAIMTPLSFHKCKCATEFNFPAVLGVAESCLNVARQSGFNDLKIENYLKQFIGAVVCVLMESNGFAKTGKKKSVPHHAFTKGEFYSSAQK